MYQSKAKSKQNPNLKNTLPSNDKTILQNDFCTYGDLISETRWPNSGECITNTGKMYY